MPRTSTRVRFGLFALEIRQDSNPSAANLQPFSKTTDLKTGSATARPYATWEPDFWLLDGQYKFLPDDLATVHVGLMSQAMSDNAGVFAAPPMLIIDFRQAHSTDSLALIFSPATGDYATLISVAFYDSSSALIRADNYAPTGTEFSTGQAVENFKQIVITFYSTSTPFRYLRLTGIDYGTLISFEGDSIKKASITEEASILSTEAPYNTFDLTLFSTDPAFSILNPTSYYAALTERQPMAVYEIIDNTTLYMGTYYLDEWENASDTESLFRAVDLVGLLDRQACRGGMWTNVTLEELLEQLLGAISVPYELDSTLYGTLLSGWLPICSYREALQQVGFAAGAVVDCSRSGAVRIFRAPIAADAAPQQVITRAEIGMKPALKLRSLVTAVEVTAHNYVAGNTSRELYNGALAAGTHEIEFSQPMHALSATGAAITASGVNYAILSVAAPGTVVLSGKEYIDTQAVARVLTPGLSAGVRPNVVKITEATLVSNANAATVADRVHRYYQQRYAQTVKLITPSAALGSVVVMDTHYSKQIRGAVERMQIDLTGGFRVETEIVGVEHALD